MPRLTQAQPLNTINPLSRAAQVENEQGGCIHATMDLFKYAYQLYPLLPAALLVQSLRLAIKARIIDMRASPYDVSGYEGCEVPLCVETPHGRKQYALEQEALAAEAGPVRAQLLSAYERVLTTG